MYFSHVVDKVIYRTNTMLFSIYKVCEVSEYPF